MSQHKTLTKKELQKSMKELYLDWSLTPKATQLSVQLDFKDYLEAFMFVARLSVHAEILKHHPELTLSYGKVKVKLTTHEAKALTKLDFDLAKRIEAVYARILQGGKQ